MKIRQDIHIHTNLSSCAERDATFDSYIEKAKGSQLELLGFSNHLWDSDVEGASHWYQPQNVDHVLQLRKEIPPSRKAGGMEIRLGCETEFVRGKKLCLTEEHMDLFDYILVPHCHTHMSVVMPPEYWEDNRLHAKFLMDSFMGLVTHPLAKKITAVVHPFVPGTRYALYNTVQRLIPDSYFREAFAAANESNIAIELNGSCILYLPDEEIPKCEYVRIFSLAKECGCKFTYGSDSHDFRTDRRLDVVEKFFEQCGIGDEDMLLIP